MTALNILQGQLTPIAYSSGFGHREHKFSHLRSHVVLENGKSVGYSNRVIIFPRPHYRSHFLQLETVTVKVGNQHAFKYV